MKQILRDYQVKAVNDLREAVGRLMACTPIDKHVGVILVAPTGSGKTTIASHIMESGTKKDMKILFLAHRKELIEQASKRLDEHDIDHGIIKAGNKRINDLPVQVASIQTLVRRLHKYTNFNLIVVDECHRTVAKSYMKVLSNYLGAVILGLTATPFRTDGRGLGGVYQEIVECSNPATLTDLGYLVPARVFTTPRLPDLKKIKKKAGDYDASELSARVDRPELVGDIYDHWKEYCHDRSTVIFATSRKHGKHINDVFREKGVRADYLDGETPDKDRTALIKALAEGSLQVVTNVGVLTEGWDCPRVSGVVLARPTQSTGLYLQMAGRALRPFPEKRDCIILDHGGNTHAHGLVTDPRFFSLDPAKKVEANKILLKTCPKCFAVFKGRVCPACGMEMPISEREEPEIVAGNLIEFQKSKQEIQDSYWKHVSSIAYRQGKTQKWAAVQYKLKFGCWPPFRLTGNIWRKYG